MHMEEKISTYTGPHSSMLSMNRQRGANSGSVNNNTNSSGSHTNDYTYDPSIDYDNADSNNHSKSNTNTSNRRCQKSEGSANRSNSFYSTPLERKIDGGDERRMEAGDNESDDSDDDDDDGDEGQGPRSNVLRLFDADAIIKSIGIGVEHTVCLCTYACMCMYVYGHLRLHDITGNLDAVACTENGGSRKTNHLN